MGSNSVLLWDVILVGLLITFFFKLNKVINLTPPHPWYIAPCTHGMLTPYPWYFALLSMVFWPLTHGISNTVPMVLWPTIHGIIVHLHISSLEMRGSKYHGGSIYNTGEDQFSIRGSIHHGWKLTLGSKYHGGQITIWHWQRCQWMIRALMKQLYIAQCSGNPTYLKN